jgi:membrane fusion protein, heavy metal efflux system
MIGRTVSFIVMVSCLLAAACSSNIAVPASEHVTKGDKNEIVLSLADQAAGMIETHSVVMSAEPQMLRVAGHIALADDRTWRVGVRADGLVVFVYAGLGDYVKKGQILARYHADEVREARAQYRTAVADLNRLESGAAQAQRNYDRAQTLLSLKAGSIK